MQKMSRTVILMIGVLVTMAAICMGFERPSTAQCGVGWTLGAGDGPGAYEICYDESRERTVLFSGTTTYEWDGIAWSVAATSGPPDRGAGAMVYDAAGQRCLLFGGYSSQGARKDLWSWDGKVWMQLASAPAEASGRGDFAMAFDRARNRLVVHGGYPGSGGLLADTLEWNPSTNSWQRWATGAIGNRYAHRMAYDEARSEIILHGGYYFTNKNDTWRWNGSVWTLVSTSGPARYVFGMTYDSARSRLVLHGGTTCCDEVEYTQTYVWNGTAWSQCAVQGPARGYMNIAYDRARDVIVLPGGMGPTPSGRGNVPETWELAMSVQSSTLNVPAEYATIQAAVDAAVTGDTVLVASGDYVESVDLRGKAILVKSAVVHGARVLAPQGTRCFVAHTGESSATRVIGFNLGRAGKRGGGVSVSNASAVFDNCAFIECRNGTGGGAHVAGGAPMFVGCDFVRCVADEIVGFYGDGGAIRSVGGSIIVSYCNFLDNEGIHGNCFVQEGGVSVFRNCSLVGGQTSWTPQIYNASGSLTIEDSLFDGGSLQTALFGWAPYTVRRSTFRNFTAVSVMDGRSGEVLIDACNFEHCHCDIGLFIQTYSLSYAIASSTFCDCSSPIFECCWSDLGGNNFNAACSCFGDLNGDGQVAGADVTIVLSGWQNGPGSTEGDLSGDGETDGIDLALLLSNWGACE
jgi:hypothetical protein